MKKGQEEKNRSEQSRLTCAASPSPSNMTNSLSLSSAAAAFAPFHPGGIPNRRIRINHGGGSVAAPIPSASCVSALSSPEHHPRHHALSADEHA
jgi:hypothetical protein